MITYNPPQGPRAPKTALDLLNAVIPLLKQDYSGDLEDLVVNIRDFVPDSPRHLETVTAHLKFAIQSFFALVEATTNALASSVLGSSPRVPNSDLAVLQEREYDEESDRCLDSPRHYSLLTRSQAAFRSFLSACHAPPRPNWDPETLEHFATLALARKRFTHPKRLEHLSPVWAYESFRQVARWFPEEVVMALAGAARGLGLTLSPVPLNLNELPPGAAIQDPSTVFNKGFDNYIFSSPGAAIAYIDQFSQRLDFDLRMSLSFCSSAQEQQIGRAIRRVIRTIAITTEGELAFASYFMRAVAHRGDGKIFVQQQVKGESVPSRLARASSAFSTAFGSGFQPVARGKSWEDLHNVFSLRDRLVHPRRPKDIELDRSHLSIAMSGLHWLVENSFPALSNLDEQKIANLVGSRLPSSTRSRRSITGPE